MKSDEGGKIDNNMMVTFKRLAGDVKHIKSEWTRYADGINTENDELTEERL